MDIKEKPTDKSMGFFYVLIYSKYISKLVREDKLLKADDRGNISESELP